MLQNKNVERNTVQSSDFEIGYIVAVVEVLVLLMPYLLHLFLLLEMSRNCSFYLQPKIPYNRAGR